MSCQRENDKEEECARKDGDNSDVIGTHPEDPRRVMIEFAAKPTAEPRPRSVPIMESLWHIPNHASKKSACQCQ